MRRQRYSTYDSGEREDERRIHPIWSGIGCILFFIVPLFSFALSELVIEANITSLSIPDEFAETVDTIVFGPVRFFWAKAALAAILTIAGYVVLSIVYSMMYFASGQSTRGPMDAPPVRRKISEKGDRWR